MLSRRSFNAYAGLSLLGTGSLLSLTDAKQDGTLGNTMPKQTRLGSRAIKAMTNGSARRRCQSWIESFVEETEGLESPEIYRRWAAIVALGAVLQQKVWIQSRKGCLFPNLYAFLVGPPGIGKSQSIGAIGKYLRSEEYEGF